MSQKYLGKNNAQELAGVAVVLKREARNGMGSMPKGARGVISNSRGFVRDGKIGFQADPCQCCGFQWYVGGMRYDDFELVPEQSAFTEEQLTWCKNYESQTGFDALMDDYIAGNESFVAAARRSVAWFEDHISSAMRKIDRIPGAD